MKKVLVKGAGVGGLTAAYTLFGKARSHHGSALKITVSAPDISPQGTASWFAGGMLAPYCERESAEQIVEDLGLEAMKWWDENLPELVTHNGTLVVAPPRDSAELARFSARTHGHETIDGTMIGKLEPDLAGRFRSGLFYRTEAHIDPRKALTTLKQKLLDGGVQFIPVGEDTSKYDIVIDATGIAKLDQDRDLRGVRGEMLLVRTSEITLSRPVRLLHPRIPLYIVPRENNIFMIGATMIESQSDAQISARSMMEFLNSAYALHPAFAEAEILEAGIGVRPSYADNFPRVKREDKVISINGLYRHGYLLAPEMARQAAELVINEALSSE